MSVTIAVLKETQRHERRVAVVPSVVAKLIKLGAMLRMEVGAGDAVKLPDAAFKEVTFVTDRKQLVADADVVLAVQPPALDVVNAMKPGAILVCFVYANREPVLLLNAATVQEQAIGFLAVLLGAGNAAGGFAVTDRMLAMFQPSERKPAQAALADHDASHSGKAR